MPLFRRIPKRGFTDPNSKVITGINISVLEDRYNAGDEVYFRKFTGEENRS